ncbi:MAG: hypothetical protein OXP07_11030 [Defluviicoccus sp.]|nr:hypothetical protein [Defluviicoccus sp.]
MFTDRIEERWIAAFDTVFGLCRVEKGEAVAILSETQSRRLNVQLAELALLRRGARPFHVTVVSPPQTAPVPVRSTGASPALQGLGPAVKALAASSLVVDLTVEGMLHAPELPDIIGDGARLLMVSNEHPDALERLVPDPALAERVKAAVKRIRAAKQMRVTSAAGSDLTVALEGAPSAGVWGYCDRPKTVAHWPGGIVVAFPAAGYATSHVGWGLNEAARYEALTMYDRRDFNGTEIRAFAGNFLYSTGANEFADRHTLGHFDLPMRSCTVSLDGVPVVESGRLVDGGA